MVQGLRFHTSTAEGVSSISGWGTQIPHAVQKKKQQKTLKSILLSLFTSGLISAEELMFLNCGVGEDS